MDVHLDSSRNLVEIQLKGTVFKCIDGRFPFKIQLEL